VSDTFGPADVALPQDLPVRPAVFIQQAGDLVIAWPKQRWVAAGASFERFRATRMEVAA